MTMICGPFADKTVAEEYFNFTEKVEARYDQPRQLEPDDKGNEMQKLLGEIELAPPAALEANHWARTEVRHDPETSVPTGSGSK